MPTQPDSPGDVTDAPEVGAARPERSASSSFQQQVRHARSEIAHARAEFDQANERIKQRTGRDLIVAILIGVTAGAVVIGSLAFVPWTFAVLALVATLLATFEFTRALQASGRTIDLIPQLIATAYLVVSGYLFPAGIHWISVFAAVAFVASWRLFAQIRSGDRAPAQILDDVLAGGFVQLYIPFLASLALIILRQPDGNWWVFTFMACAVAADIGAYAVGLLFGKHPMAPRISPKKTWEGFAGGAAAAVLAGTLLAYFLIGLPVWAGAIYAAVVFITATIGDLGESMIKRDLGIKDMSAWVPGHGGVLDRLDSLLPSAAGALLVYLPLSLMVVS